MVIFDFFFLQRDIFGSFVKEYSHSFFQTRMGGNAFPLQLCFNDDFFCK